MKRAGFTLIEMLITITIIGILAGAVLAALQGARETAKAAKTKSTITKLHYIIMSRYDEYRTRRAPMDLQKYVFSHDGDTTTGLPADEGTPISPYNNATIGLVKKIAHARLMALRDLMRMEMPDRWSDVTIDATKTKASLLIDDYEVPISSLSKPPSNTYRYFRLYREAVSNADIDAIRSNASSECLYMIVMSIPEAAEQFQSTEIGDTDGDGLKEFIDGWGRPIKFIRWPVGFVEYDNLAALDPDAPAGRPGKENLRWSTPSDLQSGDNQKEPDPFDPLKINNGYVIYPLIYSAGPDGIFDINQGQKKPAEKGIPYIYNNLNYFLPDDETDTDLQSKTHRYIGQPYDAPAEDGTDENGELNHYDNIHNHMLEVR